LIFLTVTILLMIPWTIRNYIAYDAFVLINTRTVDLRNRNDRNPETERRMNNMLNFEIINYIYEERIKNYPNLQERALVKSGLNPNNRSSQQIEAIKKDIFPDSTYFGRKLYWLVELWRPFRLSADYYPFPDARFHGNWSLRHNLITLLCYGSLLPFMIFSIYYLIRKKERVIWFLLFPPGILTVLQVQQWGIERYRHPIDSFVIILGTYGMFIVSQYIWAKRKCYKKR